MYCKKIVQVSLLGIALKENSIGIVVSFYRFIAIALNFLKKGIGIVVSVSQTFCIVVSVSHVRKLGIAESTGTWGTCGACGTWYMKNN